MEKKKEARGKEVRGEDKVTKYLINIANGLTKKKAALKAGYSKGVHSYEIEKLKSFKEAKHLYLLQPKQVCKEVNKVILQDDNFNAKIKGIDTYGKIKGDFFEKEEGEVEMGDVTIKISKK